MIKTYTEFIKENSKSYKGTAKEMDNLFSKAESSKKADVEKAKEIFSSLTEPEKKAFKKHLKDRMDLQETEERKEHGVTAYQDFLYLISDENPVLKK
jgi:hypothetical protein